MQESQVLFLKVFVKGNITSQFLERTAGVMMPVLMCFHMCTLGTVDSILTKTCMPSHRLTFCAMMYVESSQA